MNSLKTVLFVLLLSLIVVELTFTAPSEAAPRPGQQAPGFKVVTTSGQSVTLDNYRGHVLVIDFFATWCQPCRQSIPHLIEMNRKYSLKGLQILGLSADGDGEGAVKDFGGEYRINYPLALAGDSTALDYGVRSVPVMFVIDKKGMIVEIYRGFSDEIGRSMEKLTNRLLAEK